MTGPTPSAAEAADRFQQALPPHPATLVITGFTEAMQRMSEAFAELSRRLRESLAAFRTCPCDTPTRRPDRPAWRSLTDPPTTQGATPVAKTQFTDRAAARQRAAELYNAGASVRSVAADFGCSYGAAHRLLSEANVKSRSRGGNNHPGRRR
ncbi:MULTISPECIES: helix-turn-helix domain-containing protein [unclassified Streptomyces]|uniref:helix-turn-helix domain-containing protein n=1 Tax=unclassified Streptomyces TaxID=2593676 RepID=UPI00380740A5